MSVRPPILHFAFLRVVLQSLALFAVVLPLRAPAFCQPASVSTKIHGVVRDGKGRAVRNAEVSLESGGKVDRFTTSAAGDFAGRVSADGGSMRVTASAKGYEVASAQATVERDSPSCEASLVLAKGRHETAAPGSLTCEEPAPYASLPNFEAAIGDQEFAATPRGMTTSINSHFAPGEANLTSMWIEGAYIFQTKPATRKPLRIRVSGTSAQATWRLSNPEVATLSKIGATVTRIDFLRDGDTLLSIEDRDQVLRIRLNAATFPTDSTWQVKAFRVTEAGKMIDNQGHVQK